VKTKVYAAAGIPEYWIINLKQMQLIVFRSPTHEGYQSQETWVQSVISPLAFPDIEIAVERLLNG
jgi:Uma2 family endonuclease